MALFAHGQSNPDDPIENILHLAILRFGVHELRVTVRRDTSGPDTVLVDQNGREFRMQSLIAQALAAPPHSDQFYQAIMSNVDAAAKGIDAPPPAAITNFPLPPAQTGWDVSIPTAPPTGPLPSFSPGVMPPPGAPPAGPAFPPPGFAAPAFPPPAAPPLAPPPGQAFPPPTWDTGAGAMPAPAFPRPATAPPAQQFSAPQFAAPQVAAPLPVAPGDPMLQQVRLRLVPESTRELVNIEYARPAAAGLLAVLCLNNPMDVTYLTDELLIGHDVNALFQSGFSNTMSEKIDVIEEPAPAVQALMGDSLFTASKAIGMGQLVGSVLPAAPHGVVFGVPHRHLIYVHVVTGPNLIHAVNALATLVVTNATEGVPGGVLSNLTYYWRDDVIEPVGFPDADGKVQIVATGRFGKMLNEVLR